MQIPESWQDVLEPETRKTYYRQLKSFVRKERRTHRVFPPEDCVFAALEITPLAQTSVLLLGQDPYHDEGQAHGLCFSVQPGSEIPPSLRNIYKELTTDLGISPAPHGYLAAWARQGVLMLNAVLTVRAHEANSHKNKGWEAFTDAIIRAVSAKAETVVFLLWGKPAQKKRKIINTDRHVILESAHPSPLSAHRGFFGSRPFSNVNAILRAKGRREIDWQLPSAPTW